MTNESNQLLVIKAGQVIDGKSKNVKKDISIVINDNQIVDVKPSGELDIPENLNYKLLDYSDKTVLPGLVDSHVHLSGIGDGRTGDELVTLPDEILSINMANNARVHLQSGVTTVRDCGAKNNTAFHLRKAAEMDIAESPRLVLSGRPLAIIGGHLGYFGEEITGEDQCRAAVRYLVKQGADFIKVTATGGSTATSHPLRPSFSQQELNVIAEEAHKFGKHVAAHCASSEAMIRVLNAGIDTIIHGTFKEVDGTNKYREDIAELIAEKGAYVNPTIGAASLKIKTMESKKENDNFTEQDQEELDFIRTEQEHRLECFNKLINLGVPMSAGSDSAWGEYKMGNYFEEIEAHVQGGQSPVEAIMSATDIAAQSCWIDDSLGSIETGKLADILIVSEDPSKQIENLRTVVDVIKDGQLIDRQSLL